MKKIYFLTTVLAGLLLTCSVFAQAQWDYGDLKDVGPEKKVLLEDAMKAQAYAEALPQLQWFLKNLPKAHKNIYIHGAEVYNHLVEVTQDPELQVAYADSALMMYDKRIELFGEAERPTAIKNKCFYAYYYWSPRSDKAQVLYDLYKEVIGLQGKNTAARVIDDYMRLVSLKKISANPEKMASLSAEDKPFAEALKGGEQLTDEKVVEIYEVLMAITDSNMPKSSADEDWASTKGNLEAYFRNCVTIDCEYVKKTYEPKFKADPNNSVLAEQIVSLMLGSGCEYLKEPLFLQTLLVIYKAEPTDSRATSIALIYQSNGDNNKALEYFAKVSDKTNLAKAYINLGTESKKAGRKDEARNYALKAAEAGLKSEAYIFIGNLYMTSGGECTNSNPVLARACYLAAYDAYATAGFAQGMSNAQAQFPTSEDIFTLGMEVGQSIPVGCWIGGTTVLRKR
ncbi:MAG TPA: hypothetical protein DCM08_04305 [Microscillaceae bacterium]|jgi:tetratricopeptide (TPR) repeat protein|nr:hypothetical protein [Microscillaceae bacterium]